MKRVIGENFQTIATFGFLFGLVMIGFGTYNTITKENSIKENIKSNLSEEHEIIKMKNSNTLQGGISGNFFLFSGELNEAPSISFAWKLRNSVHHTTLPLTKVITVFDESRTEPRIKFKTKISGIDCDKRPINYLNDPLFVNKSIKSAVILCSSDFYSKELEEPLSTIN